MNERQIDPMRESEISFCRYNAAEARRRRDTVESVYTRSYVEAIMSGDPFDSVEAFMSRFDSYVSQDNFDLVVAYRDDEAIGQIWGWPLSRHTQWGGRGCFLNLNLVSRTKTVIERSLSPRLWYLRSGRAVESPTHYMTSSYRPAVNRAQLSWSSRKIPPPIKHIYTGVGAK
jgi:hypothetical protein